MGHIRTATENGVIVDFDIDCQMRDRQELRRKFVEYVAGPDPGPEPRDARGAANDNESPIRVMPPSRIRELIAQGHPLWSAIWNDATSVVE